MELTFIVSVPLVFLLEIEKKFFADITKRYALTVRDDGGALPITSIRVPRGDDVYFNDAHQKILDSSSLFLHTRCKISFTFPFSAAFQQFATFEVVDMDHFVNVFFSQGPVSSNSPFIVMASKCGNHIWRHLEVADVLQLSVASRSSAGLTISTENIKLITRSVPQLCRVGTFEIDYAADSTLGLLRRILFRLVRGSKAVVSIDTTSGRIVMDIGSAFNDQDAFLATTVTAVSIVDEGDEEHHIQKYLEVSSYDEYDDFAPRHPHPRDKTHRRGDSYFNSDIESFANEALALDMQSIASLALTSDDSELLKSAKPIKHARGRKVQHSISENLQDLARAALTANDSDEERQEGKQ